MSDKQKPTPEAVTEFIRDYQAKSNGFEPNQKEIANHFGTLYRNDVRKACEEAEARGWLKRKHTNSPFRIAD